MRAACIEAKKEQFEQQVGLCVILDKDLMALQFGQMAEGLMMQLLQTVEEQGDQGLPDVSREPTDVQATIKKLSAPTQQLVGAFPDELL